ncbi:MAG: formate dehydrogenase accessory sulfurtransferase FdhD [Pseudomonadota bacterium]
MTLSLVSNHPREAALPADDAVLSCHVQLDVMEVVGGEAREGLRPVATEVPFTMRANGVELATLMCSPMDLQALCCGFLMTSGVIAGPTEILSLACDDRRWEANARVLNDPDPGLLQRRLHTSGCGRGVVYASVLEASAHLPLESDLRLPASRVSALAQWLLRASPLHRATRGVHTAALSAAGLLPIRTFDDVGRHNAVDKAIGAAALAGVTLAGGALLCSGRGSAEVVHKARYCGIPILITSGSPTHQAVLRARAAGLTLVGNARGRRFVVYSRPERITLGC